MPLPPRPRSVTSPDIQTHPAEHTSARVGSATKTCRPGRHRPGIGPSCLLGALFAVSGGILLAGCDQQGAQAPPAARPVAAPGQAGAAPGAAIGSPEVSTAPTAPAAAESPAPAPTPASLQTTGSPAPADTPPPSGGMFGTGAPRASAAGHTDGDDDDLAGMVVRVEPAVLDLGEIATNDSGIGIVRLVNTGDSPRVLLECKTSCGCTTAACPRNQTIEPGGSVEVEVKLDGGARAQRLEKTVTFLVSEHPPIRLTVRGQSVAFVQVTPQTLDPRHHPDGRVTLRASDGTPFRIRSMYPAIMEDLPEEASAEHTLTIDYEAIKAAGIRQRRILVRIDHPRSDRVEIMLAPNAIAPPSPPPAQPLRTPPSSAAINRMDSLLAEGRTDEVLGLVNSVQIKVDEVDEHQQTPLIKACRWGNPRVTQALLDLGSDITVVDKMGRSALVYACQSKNLETVRLILDAGADLETPDTMGNTPLGWAAAFGTVEIVQEMLDRGAALSPPAGQLGFSPLHWAAGFGDPSVVELLLERGVDLDIRDTLEGMTPLMHAARTGRIETVRLLLARRASLTATSLEGATAFLVAARNTGGSAELLRLLVSSGSDPAARDSRGQNALDLARRRNDPLAPEAIEALTELLGK